MILNEHSKVIEFTKKTITEEEKQNLHLPTFIQEEIPHIVEINGTYYYSKKVYEHGMLNELLGSYFSKLIGLNAVDYQIGLCNNELHAISKLFYEPEFIYEYYSEQYGPEAEKRITPIKSFFSKYYLNQSEMLKLIDNPELLSQILKLIAVDLKMGQFDRDNENVILKTNKTSGITTLAPIYDFSQSYCINPPQPDFLFYDNPFVIIRKKDKSLTNFFKQYPEIIESIEILRNTPVEVAIEQIEQEKQISIPNSRKHYYKVKDKEYTKVLKNI